MFTDRVIEDESKVLAMLSQNGKITKNELAMRLGVSRKEYPKDWGAQKN